jgi:hypothetical protein
MAKPSIPIKGKFSMGSFVVAAVIKLYKAKNITSE